MTPGSELYALFHNLWTKAVGTTGYQKDEWNKLEGILSKQEGNVSVLQDWLVKIPIRMQSTLVLGLRGPDNIIAPNVKTVTRWLRGLTFKPGNPDNCREFMHSEPAQMFEKGPLAKELEFCTQHYYSHLMHSLEVVAYKHPYRPIVEIAGDRYEKLCTTFHLRIETPEDFEKRLGERSWPGGVQPDTFTDAISLLDGEGR